ncbi:hypothetical protein [Methylobacterium sp. ID0610]
MSQTRAFALRSHHADTFEFAADPIFVEKAGTMIGSGFVRRSHRHVRRG